MNIRLAIFLLGMGLFYVQPAFSNGCSERQTQCDNNLKSRVETCKAEYTGQGLGACKKAAVHEWTICWKQSEFYCESGGSVSYVGGDAMPCPKGMKRNHLGVCAAYFKKTELPPGKDGCPAGEERGDDDRCVPSVQIKGVPLADGFVVACPEGMKPSPVDGGCVMNDVGVIVDQENETGRDCPNGMQPGPNGDCVPVADDLTPKQLLNNTLTTLLKRAAAGRSELPTELAQDLNPQLFLTENVEVLYDSVSEQLNAEKVEVEPK